MSKKTRKKKTVALDDIVIRYDLYPRLPKTDYDSSQSEQAIKSYKLVLEALPPIVLNQDNILVDGWHRWEAFKRIMEDIEVDAVDDEITLSKGFDPANIEVEVMELSEDQILLEATRLNARGQVVLTRAEKQGVAERLYEMFTDKEIADALAVPRSTVNYWTKMFRERMRRIKKELVFEYADKYPDMSQKEIRAKILENEGVKIPHSSHSDWLRDRPAIEESWSEAEEEPVPSEPPVIVPEESGDRSYGEYLESEGLSAKTVEAMPDTFAPDAPGTISAFICDGYAVDKGISDKEYLQTGCLKCKNNRNTGLVGWDITLECSKGHNMVVTGLKRDR